MGPQAKIIEIEVAGKTIQAREGETLIHALWTAGLPKEIRTGCLGGVCGACTVTVRFKDGGPGKTELACLCPAENGMQIFPFPVDTIVPINPMEDPDTSKIRKSFPTLDRCTKCGSCTSSCPMKIPVMDSVLKMQKGEFEAVAEDFTTCIHCGLCRAVCEDKVKPHNMGIWVRRSLGMTREYPDLYQLLERIDEKADKEWEHLLNCSSDERMQRAKKIRSEGKV